MFEKFCDYMYYLLTAPFKMVKKSSNQWYILFKVLGRRFDDAMESLYRAREQTMVATCAPVMLPVHAEERKMSRHPGEDDENFRLRIAMHVEICRLGGTNEGVLLAVKALGYASPELARANELAGIAYDMPDTAGDRWAEFYVVIAMDADEEHPIGFDILKMTVRKWKAVGAKDNYLFRYMLSIREINGATFSVAQYKKSLHYFDYPKLDGTWSLDGSCPLNAKRTDYNIRQEYHFRIEHAKGYKVTWHAQHNLIFLDGTWNLDGSKTMDAWQETEVL